MKKLLAILLAGLMVAVVVVTGCSAKQPETQTILVGVNVSTSGTGALLGYSVSRPAEIANDWENAKGGLLLNGQKYLLKSVVYDHAFDPTKSVENVNRMILQDKVNYIHQQGGAASIPTFPIVAKAAVPMFALIPSAWPVMKPEYPYIYCAFTGTTDKADVQYKYAKDKYQVKTVVIINPDDESGRVSFEDSKTATKNNGVELKSTEYFARGSTDFYPLLTRVIALKPDMIELGMSPTEESANLIKQARELGYKGKISLLLAYDISVMVGIAGKGPLEGLMSSGTWDVNSPLLTKEEQAMRDEYLKRYGPPFPAGALTFGYSHELLIEAMKKANSADKDKVKQVLETQPLTVRGRKIQFAGASIFGFPRAMYSPIPISEVNDGKVVVTGVVEPTVAK